MFFTEEAFHDEGITKKSGLPLPVECLIMSVSNNITKYDRLHYHDYIEILYAQKGTFGVQINETAYSLPEHAMCIINAREPHATVGTGNRTLVCIKFLPQVLYSSEQTVTELEYSLPYIFEKFGSQRIFGKELLTDTGIPSLFEEICEEYQEKLFGSELVIRANVIKIFAWITRHWYHTSGAKELPAPSSTVAAMIQTARAHISENFAEATLSSTANACGLSYGYCSRMFKQYMGMRFSEYLNLVRINESVKLLATTHTEITDIAMIVGFSSTSYYIHTFHKLKNISPNKFRKLLKKAESL